MQKNAYLKFKDTLQVIESIVDTSNCTVEINSEKIPVKKLSIGSPIFGTVYGTLLNFKGELKALNDRFNRPPYQKPPENPVLYIKPVNTITGNLAPIPLPHDTDKIQVGACLGIVFKKNAMRVTENNAKDYILGYTIVNDVSIPHESYYRPAIKEKSRDGFCPSGPWIVDRDAIKDPDRLTIKVFINGELKQKNTTANLVRPISRLITDVTNFMTLYEGDTLLVGFPENPPYAFAGDHIRIEIENLGYLENTVVHQDSWQKGALQ
ncbi:fumarylacetoacetate hydrolase family protein [Heyndrickxia coagulans]|uniref:fumarylacetoacetate hydrolase family protein n=1 Tax=Heyndrickxia coagulans TaxID=1398 RepID=UPI0006287E53|nr:fumarylacetoacetate hydrolase family protein [Heyndrickxia coagulans]